MLDPKSRSQSIRIVSRAAPPKLSEVQIGVIGLGFVGLPLAVFMAQHFPVTGFDVDAARIEQLQRGVDRTREVTSDEFAAAKALDCTTDLDALRPCNVYIVTVPTPINDKRRPDLSPLLDANRTVGAVLSPGNVVIYESTVYPGLTEEFCVPELERVSGLTFNQNLYAGYSPERINPGDPTHRLPDIVKVTSGSTPETADLVDAIYAKIVTAGTHRASSIRVAEAAKVIENVQRDVNIALVNELAMLFKELGLETAEVLEAAGTKWNFQPYRPGLVGGHCIGVDPYYLTRKAEQIGFHPQMILAGRRTNDAMASFVADDILKAMRRNGQSPAHARALVMGFTYKENVPDTRNTKVIDLVRALSGSIGEVLVYDPLADRDLAKHEYHIDIASSLPAGTFDAIVLAVKHVQICDLGEAGINALLAPDGLIYDLSSVLPRGASHVRI
ncbi:Vi polysaccharide biosynthesis protein VipA/TviB [Methyloceanibacter methanicus]|uniref:Vi polysaccharide biosynthesis protein VipA/TviB n=1 Tax=Methyloceanibacter methanicus TaxID=1774968 RepID=A0A1E3W378_9HYPH|nr:nucleotide sugar dehydrogenase [Methyloceanibacter methanicus]ODR99961.1 Vi polysaccharide biosynthesis protein VipA/TviB [Methyloceanibacter methanicus]